jgi:ubiquinone/menaquinone biosynthesis C-methylase UbiE
MSSSKSVVLAGILFTVGSLAFGCRQTGSVLDTRPAPPAAEASVRPGVNDPYRADASPAKWAARFEVEGREIFDDRDMIVANVGIKNGMAVADVGAGTGLFTQPFAEAVGPTGKVYAVDIQESFVKHIRERARKAGIENVETVLCNEKSVELPRASVDLVFVCDTYHHFEYPASTLASIRSALRPGGELVVIDFERIEGKSRPWILEHVRAGKDVVTREITGAGFALTEEKSFLAENYFLRFRRIDP